jgi:hypothetical protein
MAWRQWWSARGGRRRLSTPSRRRAPRTTSCFGRSARARPMGSAERQQVPSHEARRTVVSSQSSAAHACACGRACHLGGSGPACGQGSWGRRRRTDNTGGALHLRNWTFADWTLEVASQPLIDAVLSHGCGQKARRRALRQRGTLWYEWKHGSVRSSSPFSYSHRQTMHLRASRQAGLSGVQLQPPRVRHAHEMTSFCSVPPAAGLARAPW